MSILSLTTDLDSYVNVPTLTDKTLSVAVQYSFRVTFFSSKDCHYINKVHALDAYTAIYCYEKREINTFGK